MFCCLLFYLYSILNRRYLLLLVHLLPFVIFLLSLFHLLTKFARPLRNLSEEFVGLLCIDPIPKRDQMVTIEQRG